MTSEFDRIEAIRQRLGAAWARARESSAGSAAFTRVDVSIGDDAAVLAAISHPLAISTDAQVEGVHFTRELLSHADIAFRAFSAAISDLAAMGATPSAALTALILPTTLDDAALNELIDGFAAAQQHYACPVVGGNLARGSELSITTTVLGALGDRALLRSGARAGDGLYVTGVLGASALGLRLLQRHRAELAPACVSRFQRPEARIAEGQRIAKHASAAIDVSDGLLQDLGHVCNASDIGCDVELAHIPLPDARHAADILGLDLLDLALAGGEDFELLFASATPPTIPATRIGTFSPTRRIRLLDARGHELPLPRRTGFDHFASTP